MADPDAAAVDIDLDSQSSSISWERSQSLGMYS
jgi:hypothetical protein